MIRTRLTPEEGTKWLIDHDFVKLPQGSYIQWIEKTWLPNYKRVLSYKNGAWVPSLNKLGELQHLDEVYKEYQFKQYGTRHYSQP